MAVLVLLVDESAVSENELLRARMVIVQSGLADLERRLGRDW
jgi:hypothetical protein